MSRRTPFALVCLALATPLAAHAAPTYAVAGKIAGPDGRWDYANVDPSAGRLFIAHGDDVAVIDLAAGKALPSIGHIARGHAAVPIPGHHLLLVTSGGDDSARLLDETSGAEVARIAVGAGPDAAIYDAASGRAYVMNAKAGTVSAIDIAKRAVVATVKLKPDLESAAIEGRTLYIADEGSNEIERIDLAHDAPLSAIPLPGCEGPAGLGGDARTHQLVAACHNGHAAVVDTRKGALVRLLPIGAGPDAVIVDAERRLAFVPCGRDGVLDLIALDGANGASGAGRVTTEAGARSGALDPRDGSVYLTSASFGPAPAGGGRPAMLPGTFHVLVVRPAHG